jgi:hypothetical protein
MRRVIRFFLIFFAAFGGLLAAAIDSGGGVASLGGGTDHSSIGGGFDTSASATGLIEILYPEIPAGSDADGNGLPDAWETQHFGATGASSSADLDGDGPSHLMEYLAGTDPSSAASVFRPTSHASGGNMTYAETIGTVGVANGTYSFQFGASGNGIVSVLSGQDFLALTVNGTEETTRTRLLAVPYALKSADAQALRDELVVARGLNGGNATTNMIRLSGGVLPQDSGLAGTNVAPFQIGKYEVTYGEWLDVVGWSVSNGYDLSGVGGGSSNQNPVSSVSWYDVVKWMNAKSEKEGWTPVYQVGGAVYKTGQSDPTLNSSANGYRLPSEAEWEWAARGGVSSQGYAYSGSYDVNAVAWYASNAAGGTKAVGTKAANELAIHDMSGNVWEWCWDLYDPQYSTRRFRGGSHYDGAYRCAVAYRDNDYGGPDLRVSNLGFRLARSSGN